MYIKIQRKNQNFKLKIATELQTISYFSNDLDNNHTEKFIKNSTKTLSFHVNPVTLKPKKMGKNH